jgi:preprotein translocase subunit YajC
MRISGQILSVLAVILIVGLGVALAATTEKVSPGNSAPPPNPGGGTNPSTPDQNAPAQGKGGGFDMMWMIVLLIGGFLVLNIFMGRGRRKQETKRKEMLANLKKGDRIVTIGGVIGTVMDTKEDEVTVKVDEANNVRVRFSRWAIRGVGEEAKAEGQQKQERKS